MSYFSNLLQKMDAVVEGDATMLDNSSVMFSTCVAWGKTHTQYEWPCVIGGRGGRRADGSFNLKGGWHYRPTTSGDNFSKVLLDIGKHQSGGDYRDRQGRGPHDRRGPRHPRIGSDGPFCVLQETTESCTRSCPRSWRSACSASHVLVRTMTAGSSLRCRRAAAGADPRRAREASPNPAREAPLQAVPTEAAVAIRAAEGE